MFSNDIHRTLDIRIGIEEQAGNGWTFHKKELIDLMEGEIDLTQFDDNSQINRTNILVGITDVVRILNSTPLSNP